MRRLLTIALAVLVLLGVSTRAELAGGARPESQSVAIDTVEGLWAYKTIARRGAEPVTVAGLFLIRSGRFVQQSLESGEPVDSQQAQAHMGRCQIDGSQLKLTAEVGIVVVPTSKAPVSYGRDLLHVAKAARSGDTLTLTFESGTVHSLTRVGPGVGEVLLFDRGSLALVDGYFVLVAEDGRRAVAGSGRYRRAGKSVDLSVDRWFSLTDSVPTYTRGNMKLSLDDTSLTFPDGLVLHVK